MFQRNQEKNTHSQKTKTKNGKIGNIDSTLFFVPINYSNISYNSKLTTTKNAPPKKNMQPAKCHKSPVGLKKNWNQRTVVDLVVGFSNPFALAKWFEFCKFCGFARVWTLHNCQYPAPQRTNNSIQKRWFHRSIVAIHKNLCRIIQLDGANYPTGINVQKNMVR